MNPPGLDASSISSSGASRSSVLELNAITSLPFEMELPRSTDSPSTQGCQLFVGIEGEENCLRHDGYLPILPRNWSHVSIPAEDAQGGPRTQLECHSPDCCQLPLREIGWHH